MPECAASTPLDGSSWAPTPTEVDHARMCREDALGRVVVGADPYRVDHVRTYREDALGRGAVVLKIEDLGRV